MTKAAFAVVGAALELYETQINPMRVRYARETALAQALDPAINPDLIEGSISAFSKIHTH